MSHELLHTHTHLHFFIKVYFIHTHTHTLYFLYPQQRGKKTLLSLTLICYCHLVSKAEIVRGSAALLQYDHETPLLVDLADLLYISTALHCLVAADPFTGDVSAGHLTIALFTLYHLPTRFFSFLWTLPWGLPLWGFPVWGALLSVVCDLSYPMSIVNFGGGYVLQLRSTCGLS